MVARRAGGSMRDAQSLLDQLLAFGSDRLTADQVHVLLGTAGDDRIAAFAEAVLAPDPKRSLELLDEAVVGGLQLGELLDQLIAYWRDLMIVQVAGAAGRDLSVPARHVAALEAQAKAVGLDAILAGLDVLSTAKARLRGSSHGRTLVEMALVRLGRLHDLVSVGTVAQWLTRPSERGPANAAAAPRAVPPEAVKKKLPPREVTAATVELTEATLSTVWAQTLGMVGAIHGRELERAGLPAIFAPNTLVLRFPAAYNQSREFCQESGRLGGVEDAIRKVTGQLWKLRLESLPGNANADAGDASVPPSAVRPRHDGKEDAAKVPVVKRAIEVLGADIRQVDEGFGGTVNGE
jgi:DNA polymerase-3 subunit gamma/tau